MSLVAENGVRSSDSSSPPPARRIGLGNIWRFPYTVGQNGGGAFVMLYLFFVALIGVPVLMAELSLGRSTEKSAVGAFKRLMPDSWWPSVGGIGVTAGFGILSFYSVIAGWTLSYLYLAVQGRFGGSGLTAEQSGQVFSSLTSNPVATVVLTAAFLILTALVVRGGVSGGIERAAKILMPIFLVILLILVGRSVSLSGAGEGLKFLFTFDASKLTAAAVVSGSRPSPLQYEPRHGGDDHLWLLPVEGRQPPFRWHHRRFIRHRPRLDRRIDDLSGSVSHRR